MPEEQRKITVVKASERDSMSPHPSERVLAELKKIKDELLTLAKRLDKLHEHLKTE